MYLCNYNTNCSLFLNSFLLSRLHFLHCQNDNSVSNGGCLSVVLAVQKRNYAFNTIVTKIERNPHFKVKGSRITDDVSIFSSYGSLRLLKSFWTKVKRQSSVCVAIIYWIKKKNCFRIFSTCLKIPCIHCIVVNYHSKVWILWWDESWLGGFRKSYRLYKESKEY